MKFIETYWRCDLIRRKNIWISFLCWFLIIYFFSAVAIIPSIHISDVGHDHDPFNHCQDEEKDPCHRKIFHHDYNNGCQHDSHYSSPDETCGLCDLFLNKDLLSYFNEVRILNEFCFSQEFNNTFNSFEHTSIVAYKGRAPPRV